MSSSITRTKPVPTPCIGVCSTALGDSVCRGCKRFAHEVIHWNEYDAQQKHLIDQRLQSFLARVMQNYLLVVDQPLLEQRIREHNIRIAPHKNVYGRSLELMRAGGEAIREWHNFGLLPLSESQDWTVEQMRHAIDEDFLKLSRAHFERYFSAHERAEPL